MKRTANINHLKLKENEKNALQELKRKLFENFPEVSIILYGSKARGDDQEFSDMDILILIDGQLTRLMKEKISEIKFELELIYDVIFGTIIESRTFWNSPHAHAMPFHKNIEREGIML